MDHHYVGAEHVFFAIIRDRNAVPTQVLTGPSILPTSRAGFSI
jgi:hypothetical protein